MADGYGEQERGRPDRKIIKPRSLLTSIQKRKKIRRLRDFF